MIQQFHSWIFIQKNKSIVYKTSPQKDSYRNVFGSCIHRRPINKRMDRQIVEYSCIGDYAAIKEKNLWVHAITWINLQSMMSLKIG